MAISVTTSTITFSRLLEPFIGAWPVWPRAATKNLRRAQSEDKCAALNRALCAGRLAAPRVHTPPRPWKLSKPCHACCESQKHLRVGEEWAGTDFYEQTVLRARKPHARLLHCNHGLCGE